jgi:phenylacetate-CoA ligase
MRKFITRKIAYPLQDYYNQTSILPTYKLLLESAHWSEEQLKEFQFRKFKMLFEHAHRNVPYYDQLFSSIKLKPEDIRSFDDLYKIPILTKETARTKNNELIPRNLPKKHIHKGVTGGTTGPPLKLLRDAGDLSFTWAAFFRWYNWMEIEIGDPVTKIWGTRTVLSIPFSQKAAILFKNWYYNRTMVNSFNLNDNTLQGAVDQLNRFKPKLIRGYLSAFIQIAEFMKERDIRLDFTPTAVSTTTETLFEPFRKLIQDQFGAPLYDQYGCGECNSIAFEAGDGLGLYVTAEHVYIEILNDSDMPEYNHEGRIILTNLDNYAMPLIRYENGDSGQFAATGTKKKFNLPLLKSISGRTADTIVLANGSKVHGVFLTDILNELFQENPDYIHRFQAYQEVAGELEFRIESGKNLPDDYLSLVENALNRFFTRVTITTLKNLPLDASGKFRYVVSKIKA